MSAPLSDIITVSISTAAAPIKSANFGVPLILGNSNRFSEPTRTYTSTAGMLSDGFLATDPETLAAGAIFAQSPSIPTIVVGKRTLRSTPTATLTPVAVNSKAYKVYVQNTAATYTSDATATVAEIVAGLKVAIDALSLAGVTTTDNTTHLSIAVAQGAFLRIRVDATPGNAGPDNLALDWTHADPGIATDLGLAAAHSSAWYGLLLAGSTSPAEYAAAYTWAESNGKLLIFASNQSIIITTALSGGTDLATVARAASLTRSADIYHSDNGVFADAAALGNRFTFSPGSEAWKFAQLSGIPVDNLTATHLANLAAKNCGWVTDYGGVGILCEGKLAGGGYIDTTRGVDGLRASIQEEVYATLLKQAAAGKTPYTDAGAASIKAAILASLDRFERSGFLSPGSSSVTVPTAASQSAGNKAARLFAGITFSALGAGAIHGVTISGIVEA